jgi:hypothetical protein
MEAPRQLRFAADQQDDITITYRDYDDENVIVVDFGPGVEATLDVVGDTAIVVANGEQYEFEVPEEASDISVNDGMLVIEE